METLQLIRPVRGIVNGDCIGADGHKNHLIGCDGTKNSVCRKRREKQNNNQNPTIYKIYKWIEENTNAIKSKYPQGYPYGWGMALPTAQRILSEDEFQRLLIYIIKNELGVVQPPNIWSEYDQYKDQYREPVSKVPRTGLVKQREGSRKQKTQKPQNEQRRFPYHVTQREADKVNRICPALGLKEGTVVYRGDKKKFRIISLEGDHVEKFNGVNTTPENFQILSNVANGLKTDGCFTHEQLKERAFQLYVVVTDPEIVERVQWLINRGVI